MRIAWAVTVEECSRGRTHHRYSTLFRAQFLLHSVNEALLSVECIYWIINGLVIQFLQNTQCCSTRAECLGPFFSCKKVNRSSTGNPSANPVIFDISMTFSKIAVTQLKAVALKTYQIRFTADKGYFCCSFTNWRARSSVSFSNDDRDDTAMWNLYCFFKMSFSDDPTGRNLKRASNYLV